jgi:hypothetical protein
VLLTCSVDLCVAAYGLICRVYIVSFDL